MYKVHTPVDGILCLDLSGRLDAAQIRGALEELMHRAGDGTAARLMMRFEEVKAPTLGAVAPEVRRLPELARFLRRIRRAAIISDQDWIREQARAQAALMPDIKIRSFRPAQDSEAEAFLVAA